MSPFRRATTLDGSWQLDVLDGSSLSATVRVPAPWTIQVPGYGDSHETVRYTRRFEWIEPHSARPQRHWLRFAGVHHTAEVTLNGVVMGSHHGGWTSFEFDVSDFLIVGENALEVVVSYPPRWRTGDEPSFLEIPHGKQSWYGTTAGIWQSVSLETRDLLQLVDVRVRPDAGTATIGITAGCARVGDATVTARASFRGVQVAEAEVVNGTATLTLDEPQLWGIDEPNLYDVTVEASVDGDVVDAVTMTTGLRTFETRDGKFYLNGGEVELRGVLDQDYHPDSSSIPESTEALTDLFLKTRELGFNMLRVHIKRPDPRYYEIADKLGMLVWTELPSWLIWTPQAASHGKALLEQFIREDSHHPSIVVWTIINESWGMDQRSARQRTWLHDTFREIKELTSGSLVVDNSACRPNFHIETDIDDYHVYRGIPEARREWDSVIAEFAQRPSWTFSPHGDAHRTHEEPLVLSEYGNWALPHMLDQIGDDGAEPWWFTLGSEWAFGAGDGTNLMARFRQLGLEDVFGSWDALIAGLHKAQLVANRYQTTSIRLHPEISGYVLTQLSDVQWEANGLFDMNRTPKQGASEFALANGDCAVALRPQQYSLFEYDTTDLHVTVIPTRGATSPLPAVLLVSCDGEELLRQDVDLTVRHETVVGLQGVGLSREMDVRAELVVADAVVARDRADVLLVSNALETPLPIASADPAVREWLVALGYSPATAPKQDHLLVTRLFDDAAQSFARNGGRVLLLVEDADALADGFEYLPSAKLGPRSGDGDWVPRNEWLDRRGVFRDVPGDPILGIAFEDILGPLAIFGIPGPMRSAHVLSGIFSGWLRGSATTSATVAWSEGYLTLTTFQLRRPAKTAPVAVVLTHAMIQAASGK
ncbi:glycoside hydrolase family 2 protein [Tessaracoccus sp.]